MQEEITKTEHKPNGNPLTSFAWFPPQIAFATQKEKEKVILLIRQHWITNVGWILLAIIFAIFPTIFLFYQDQIIPADYFLREPQVLPLCVIIWYLLVTGFIFSQFLNWYFNVNIVTTERIIDVDFHNVLYKNVSEAELERIQDVTHKNVGTLSVLFDYGAVMIQTAAEFSDIEFLRVPNPAEIHKIITDLLEQKRRNR